MGLPQNETVRKGSFRMMSMMISCEVEFGNNSRNRERFLQAAADAAKFMFGSPNDNRDDIAVMRLSIGTEQELFDEQYPPAQNSALGTGSPVASL